MRTKTLLLAAAALSAGVFASSAQVYSANVVGYVNKVFVANGTTLWCNPLMNTTNSLNQLIPQAWDGSTIFRYSDPLGDWNPVTATFYADAGSGFGPGSWFPGDPSFGSEIILPGEGLAFLNAGEAFTNTFVGDVMQGNLTLTVKAGGSLISSQVPIGGAITNVFQGLVLADGSSVSSWNAAEQLYFPDTTVYYDGIGFAPGDYPIAVGEAVFLINVGGDVVWNRTFTVQ